MKDYLKQYINNQKFSDIGGKGVPKVPKGSEVSVGTRWEGVPKVPEGTFGTFGTGQGVGYAENLGEGGETQDALLAPTCPVCGGALLVEENDRYRYVQCTASPLDYFLITNKRPGRPMGLFTTERINDVCVDCQMIATTYNGRCDDCLTRWCASGIDVGVKDE